MSINRFIEVCDSAYKQEISLWTGRDGKPLHGKPGPVRHWGDVLAARDAVAEWAECHGHSEFLGPKIAAVYAALKACASLWHCGAPFELRDAAAGYMLARESLESLRGIAGGSRQTAKPKGPEKYEWLAQAMLVVEAHPEWPDAKIAKAVNRSGSTLSRSPKYQAAAAMARENCRTRRGHVITDEDGLRDVEAYDEDADIDS